MHVRNRRARGIAAALGVGAVLVTACGNSTDAAHVTRTYAVFAEQPTGIPDYILPLASNQYFTAANLFQFQYLMYRPLYWFGTDGQVQLNQSLSLADPPSYAKDGKSVTVTLKGWKWSDGMQITARDIQFWQNLVAANKAYWPAYTPGEYPDNVIGTKVNPSNPLQITFDLSRAYGSYFFTYNELSQITPLPQHIWDRESATGAVGNYDETPAGARAVYAFLDKQSRSVTTYDTNPLWEVVSGPWRLHSIDTSGKVTMVPNPEYGGPVKPTLKEFDEVPFTQDTTEFNELKDATSVRDAKVDFGYIPPDQAPQASALNGVYRFEPWNSWSVNDVAENFTNPTSGPIFAQLYFRQAMQDLVDQNTFITKAFFGYATPTYGPVPTKPSSAFVDPFERSNPYPYNPTAAVSLLKDNGWTVRPGGVSTCEKPGTAGGDCGAGIRLGQQAAFTLEYVSNDPTAMEEFQQLQPDFALAGIQVTLSQGSFDDVINSATPCVAGSACTWDLAYWDSPWIYAPDYYPTGDELWACVGSGASAVYASSNVGGYCDPQAEADIVATQSDASLTSMHAYEDYLARTLPVIWFPVQDFALTEINRALKGVGPLDPLLQIYPENWHWS